MKKLSLLLCLVSVAITQATLLDPRGARPVEPATRDQKCATQREWPFCTDDDWYSKCPSGCRIQGLMDKNDHELLKKIAKIRSLLDQHKARHRSVDLVSKQTYDILTEKLTMDSGNDNMYYNLAQTLRQRITEMKVRIDRQHKALAALKARVKDQVVEMQKLEIDIDIKLRSCKGSCGAHTVYQVDRDSYVALDKQVNQLDAQVAQSVETVGTLYVMKSRPLQDVIVDSRFKSKDVAGQRTADLFPQVRNALGSPETTGQPSVGVSTKTVSCTKTVRRTVVHTKDGPVEQVEEVGGGPGCDGMGGLTKGGMGSLFPTLTGSSSSSSFSSSSSSLSFHSGGSKGSILADSKSGLDPFGADFGAFMTDNAEDDIPDFHARSVKSTVVERQADFVGTGTKTTELE
uniref:Fibrinogen alpha/beta/gamma chain coiled coil domain-containing protein n=1 Tax=Xiphophorus couchianus TaxID=32473 RepID=A0A3B5LDH1_9TELE